MKGLIVFSFALGDEEPNPCNVRLARATENIVLNEKVTVAAQWEVAKALKFPEIIYIIKEHRQKGKYLDSEEVMAQAAEVFRPLGIREVIPVANPFLHLAKCRVLVKKAGFIPVKRKIGRIGFYRKSLQWWTRRPLSLLLYAVLQKLTEWKGQQS